jgi:inner membrane protein
MHIPTHLMLFWVVGHRLKERRDRTLVTWAGVAADSDGLTILAGIDAYGQWHHVFTHGLFAALVFGILFSLWAKNPFKVWWASLAAFHLHLACDLRGSGTAWPIRYLWPFSAHFFNSPYGWELDSWQNSLIAVILLLICGRLAIRHGYSFSETFLPKSAAVAVVQALRSRFAVRIHSEIVNHS